MDNFSFVCFITKSFVRAYIFVFLKYCIQIVLTKKQTNTWLENTGKSANRFELGVIRNFLVDRHVILNHTILNKSIIKEKLLEISTRTVNSVTNRLSYAQAFTKCIWLKGYFSKRKKNLKNPNKFDFMKIVF